MEPESLLPHSQVPATCPYPESTLSFACCVILPPETPPPPPEIRVRGVVYLRIVLSPEEASRLVNVS
jgi:hypothetical protein